MGLTLNTNIAALNARNASVANFKTLNNSLEKLSTGLKINSAADDASGLQIANSLRTQSSSMSVAIRNANDGIAIMQIADSAMNEQIKIVELIKAKAIQASHDGQSEVSRKALQQDISKLLEELDNIATNTTFNSQQILSGSFVNKEFQIGAYSNQTVKVSIDATASKSIGHARYETGSNITKSGMIDLKLFANPDGRESVALNNLIVSYSPNTGIGRVAEEINKYGGVLQMKASYSVRSTGDKSITAGDIKALKINGIDIGNVNDINTGDSDGKLVAAINSRSNLTGVEAFVDQRGYLNLKSRDGRGIVVSSAQTSGQSDIGLSSRRGGNVNSVNYGRLTLTRLNARDIIVSATMAGKPTGALDIIGMNSGHIAETTVNLKDSLVTLSKDQASALGIHDNKNAIEMLRPTQAGVLTTVNAINIMTIADSALAMLNKIRSSVGSTQKQLERVINNLSITSVNIRAAESNIRDVDFADETREFQKYQILAQSGNYALSQANATQQLILKLLQ